MNNDRLAQLFRFLEKSPDDSFTLYSIAYEYMRGGEYKSALTYFKELKAQDPQYVGLYYHLGKVYELLDQISMAKQTYQVGIAIAEQQKDTHAKSELERALTNILYEEDE